MRIVMAHNHGVKLQDGQRRRESAAIGANEALSLVTREASLPEPPEFDVEYEQIDQVADEKRIEEGFHVERDLNRVPSDKQKQKRGPGRPRKPAFAA